MKTNKGFIVPLLLGIIVLLLVGGGVYVYKNKKTEIPTQEQSNTQTSSQASVQNNFSQIDCGAINWDTFFRVGGILTKQPLTDSEKITLSCADESLLNCSPATLEVNNQGNKLGRPFEDNNYKILGKDGDFCKISADVIDTKTQKITTGVCKIPISDFGKFSKEMTGFSLGSFIAVENFIVNKTEDKGFPCSLN